MKKTATGHLGHRMTEEATRVILDTFKGDLPDNVGKAIGFAVGKLKDHEVDKALVAKIVKELVSKQALQELADQAQELDMGY